MDTQADYIADDHPPVAFRIPCGDVIGTIHRDGNRVPYLEIIDQHGNTINVYGYALIITRDGQRGQWQPGIEALAKMIARKLQMVEGEILKELQGE